MVRWIYLRTDNRVREVARHFEAAPGWEVVGPIDSANWGEGYDLRWGGVPVRLHDDVRSDEVMRRGRGGCPPGEWERQFQVVAEEMSGEVTVSFAIDYRGEANPVLYPDVAESIRAVLLGAGYEQDSVTEETTQ